VLPLDDRTIERTNAALAGRPDVLGDRTSLTLSAPSGDALADGEKSWSGELPETGDYRIHIGTDATANYTLEVTIR
jgi:hypothetical protein